jgi:FtsP/CotA-like multicopper oxidase with cupredoxin domain
LSQSRWQRSLASDQSSSGSLLRSAGFTLALGLRKIAASVDVTNPDRWMAHCHIAEHHESGMMFSFNVE